MKNISIEWTTDTHNCDTCGTSYAEGAIVRLNDEIILNLEPIAHCYDGDNYNQNEVYNKILEYLGYTVSEK